MNLFLKKCLPSWGFFEGRDFLYKASLCFCCCSILTLWCETWFWLFHRRIFRDPECFCPRVPFQFECMVNSELSKKEATKFYQGFWPHNCLSACCWLCSVMFREYLFPLSVSKGRVNIFIIQDVVLSYSEWDSKDFWKSLCLCSFMSKNNLSLKFHSISRWMGLR